MNLSIDERTKHRLTGLVVLLAIAIIFLPAMLKKSNQRIEENVRLSVQLPPKPEAPKVAIAEEPQVFETVRVEKISLPKPPKAAPASQIARIENLEDKPQVVATVKKQVKPALRVAKKTLPTPKTVPAAIPAPVEKSIPVPTETAAETYAVQLASFSVQQNAVKLVGRLQELGYRAQYRTISSSSGPIYKVIVGKLDDRADAKALKEKLSNSINMNGFIVKREVS